VTAFIASVFGSLVQLINASVFLLAFVYLATCVSAFQLRRKDPNRSRFGFVVPIAGAVFSLSLMVLVDINQIMVSAGLLAVGVPIYMFFSPKKELHELRTSFFSREAVLRRTYLQGERFLAYPLRRMIWFFYKLTHKSRPWVVDKPPADRR
jgi:amino acid transporter